MASDEVERHTTPPCHALALHLSGELAIAKKVGLQLLASVALGSYLFFFACRRTAFFLQGYGMPTGTLSNGPLYDVGQHAMMHIFKLPDMARPHPDAVIQQQRIDQVHEIIGWTHLFMTMISLITILVPLASWYAAWTTGQIPKHAVYLDS